MLDGIREVDADGEKEAKDDGGDGCQEGGEHVFEDDEAEAAVEACLIVAEGGDDKHEDKQRRDGFEGTHEEAAQDADGSCLRTSSPKRVPKIRPMRMRCGKEMRERRLFELLMTVVFFVCWTTVKIISNVTTSKAFSN